jgi:hypothetical protein
VQNGPESVKDAPVLDVAKRTLDGEDHSEMIAKDSLKREGGAKGWRKVVRQNGAPVRRS